MRYLLAIVILAALAWSGWWWFGAHMRERVLTDWLDERRQAGWVAEAADLRVTGFPNRLDTIVTGLELADPQAGWAWSAPEFQILSLTWKPHHFIAAWPGEQVVSTPLETLRITGDEMRGSLVFEPNLALRLDRAIIEIANMTIRGDGGWQTSLGTAVLAAKQAGDGAPDHAYDIAFDAGDLVLPDGWSLGIDRGAVLPETIGSASLDALAEFDRDWDRPAVEQGNPALDRVRIRDLSLVWGRLDLRAQGTLEVDAQGFAEGRIDLRARNWQEMLAAAESGGMVPNGLSGALRGGLDLFAMLSGDRDSLEVPLVFRDGQARLGPVVIGAAPRLALR